MRYSLLIIAFLLLGCQDVERPVPPDDLLSKEKMSDIMADLYLSNAAKSVNNWMLKSNGITLDTYVFKKHGVDSLQFVESNAYYTSDLNAYYDIFVRVEAKLAKLKVDKDSLKADFDKRRRLDAIKRDSAQDGPPRTLNRDSIVNQRQLVPSATSHPHEDSNK